MAKDVKCSVDSCKYYCDGCCEANCIHVGNCHCVEAKKNAETACDTFESNILDTVEPRYVNPP